jgi:hypothetical protein
MEKHHESSRKPKNKVLKNGDIDEIFRNKAKPKVEKKIQVQYKNRNAGGNDGLRFTEEGYRILKLDELVSKEGGFSPLCPFDCKCCY